MAKNACDPAKQMRFRHWRTKAPEIT